MATNAIEGAWDDENGRAYVLGTTNVGSARTYYREVYLPETFGTDETQQEVQWGIELTEDEPRLVWVPEEEVLEETWVETYSQPAAGRLPVLIWG